MTTLALLLPLALIADEGQWPPGQLKALDLQRKGLALTPEELWGTETSLLQAVVNYGGCSASFISDQGLIATNHHCAYGAIQANSSVDQNHLKNGFLARKKSDELPTHGRSTVSVLLSIQDVTAEVLAAAKDAKEDRARHLAIEKKRAELVTACEKANPAHRCSVAGFFFGARFELHTTFEIRDVRIVYAPPASIGEYGGEIDNWMWPRHTGDFTLLRAYVGQDGQPADPSEENVPFKPKRHLTIGHQGVRPGDFVAVIGYPGHTDRYLPAVEIKRQVEQALPGLGDLYRSWINILDQAAASDPAVAIKVAAKRKSFANREKNGRGMVAGIRRMNLLARRAQEDAKLALNPENKRVLRGLAELSEARAKSFDEDVLARLLPYGPDLLAIAVDLVQRAHAQKKPDLSRRERYADRNQKRLWRYQARRLKNFDGRVDLALLASVLTRARAVGWKDAGTRTAAQLLQGSKLHEEARVKRLFDKPSLEALAAEKDPLIDLALAWHASLETIDRRRETRAGAMSRLGPKLIEMLKGIRSGPIYPDANGTLRFSYATVKGYVPRDGLRATPQTTLSGAVAKHTGDDPFDLPERVRAEAAAAASTYWADPILEDVPICFLSTADTTGGNSGSAAINGRGELVGLNFDRVWENIAGDYGYSTDRSRNIIADVRYLLFLLDKVEKADALMEELGLTALRMEGRRLPPPPPVAARPVRDPPGASCQAVPGGNSGLWLLAGVLLIRSRRSARRRR